MLPAMGQQLHLGLLLPQLLQPVALIRDYLLDNG
jgi:hypothetical protein